MDVMPCAADFSYMAVTKSLGAWPSLAASVRFHARARAPARVRLLCGLCVMASAAAVLTMGRARMAGPCGSVRALLQ